MGNSHKKSKKSPRRKDLEEEVNDYQPRLSDKNISTQTTNCCNPHDEQLPQDQEQCSRFVQPSISYILWMPVGNPVIICPQPQPDNNFQPQCYPQQSCYQPCIQPCSQTYPQTYPQPCIEPCPQPYPQPCYQPCSQPQSSYNYPLFTQICAPLGDPISSPTPLAPPILNWFIPYAPFAFILPHTYQKTQPKSFKSQSNISKVNQNNGPIKKPARKSIFKCKPKST